MCVCILHVCVYIIIKYKTIIVAAVASCSHCFTGAYHSSNVGVAHDGTGSCIATYARTQGEKNSHGDHDSHHNDMHTDLISPCGLYS